MFRVNHRALSASRRRGRHRGALTSEDARGEGALAEAFGASSAPEFAGDFCSPPERSFHKARRFEISRMLSLQHLMASLWY